MDKPCQPCAGLGKRAARAIERTMKEPSDESKRGTQGVVSGSGCSECTRRVRQREQPMGGNRGEAREEMSHRY